MSAGVWSFRAVDALGAPVRGELEGPSLDAITDQLRTRGLTIVHAEPKRKAMEIDLDRFSRLKAHDLMVMTRQLATMVSAGLTLLRALRVLEEQTEAKKLKQALADVRRDVESGTALSDAMERHPKVFDTLYVSMVRAGETGGFLDTTLIRVAEHLEAADRLRRQVKSAMVYPAVVLSFAMIVLFALVTFIVPVFVGVFKQFGGDLPAITQFTVGLSNFCKHWGWTIPIMGFGGFYAFRKWKVTDRGRAQWDRFRLRLPMKIGDIVQKVALARWSRTFSALISAGVPLLQAIDITGKTAGNFVVEEAMEKVLIAVKQGGTISGPLKDADVFPTMVGHMVGVGEETGELDKMLEKIAEFYEDQVAAAVKALTSILEPVMIVVIGAVVGFIVISMYMPMFKVYDQIG
jgi:type IV pilus assembly protein PilC